MNLCFAKAKSEGDGANPLKSFGNRYNLKFAGFCLALQWVRCRLRYWNKFYTMSFMKTVMSIDSSQVDTSTRRYFDYGNTFLYRFGWLSKVGRKATL
jgi:hypothetical protein